jgi:hypothetical protein
MDQNALTVVADIRTDQLAALDALLTQIGDSLLANPYLDVSRLSTTHFLRWVILPGEGASPAKLLLESNHDGDFETYARHLIAEAGTALDAIYSKCAGYPAAGVADKNAVVSFLRACSLPPQAFYIGYRGRSVETVQAALKARTVLAQFLDEALTRHALAECSKEQIWAKIQAEAMRLGIAPIPPRRTVPNAVYGLVAIAGAAGLTAFLTHKRAWLPVLGVAGIFAAFLRRREQQDAEEWKKNARARYLPSYGSHAQAQNLAVKEDILAQNQLTHVVRVKPGAFRHTTLVTVLRAVNLLAKIVFNQGNLGGIPSIHFARWVLLDDGRLVFFSNYDGSWDNYLGDFVDRAALGLTGVWSNTEDFPPTRFLPFDGACAIEIFKAWTRSHQVPTQVWYSAYPNNTVVNIRDAVQILENLGQPIKSQTLSSWLRRL